MTEHEKTITILMQTIMDFSKTQSEQKAMLGKPDYQSDKMAEEISELWNSISEMYVSPKKDTYEQLSENFIEELGDVIFCVAMDKKTMRDLLVRLKFNWHRARVFSLIDQFRIENPVLSYLFDGLKMSQTAGWHYENGREVPSYVMSVLEVIEKEFLH